MFIEYLTPRGAFSTGFGWIMVSPKQWAFVLTAVAEIFSANLDPIASLVNFLIFSVLIQLFLFTHYWHLLTDA
jgi:threonine/homoserine/homoserine lactone efflux protein